MIVADTSAWVAFLRAESHPVATAMRELLHQRPNDIAVTEVVVMEIEAGARDEQMVRELRTRLLAHPLLTISGLADYERAAALHRTCRRAGETIRSMTDLLIAVPAMRADAEVLHKDRDFDVIARHSDLRVHVLDG